MKNTKKLILTLSVLVVLIGFGAMQVQATLFSYSVNNPGGNNAVGTATNISTQYNDVTNNFSWSTDFTQNGGDLPNGFWLVVNNGPNPKASSIGELGIIYGDLVTGNLAVYNYNGLNSASSWTNPGEYIQGFNSAINVNSTATTLDLDFSIDVSGINSYTPTNTGPDPWQGIQFDLNLGYWYHPFIASDFTFDSQDGSIASLVLSEVGWYDKASLQTVPAPVPEPATSALLLAGLAGVAAGKRLRKRKE